MSKKFVILSSIALIILAVSIWAYSVSVDITKDLKETREFTEKSNENVVVRGLLLTETKEGKKFWEVFAQEGEYLNNKSIANMKSVEGNIYKDNKLILSFKAPKATYFADDKELKLSGGVVAASDSKMILSSKELEWSNKDDLFYASGNVKIKQEKKFLSTGNYSVFNRTFTDFKMSGNAKTRIYQ
jgi:LPS export ABC transporter protein LptC